MVGMGWMALSNTTSAVLIINIARGTTDPGCYFSIVDHFSKKILSELVQIKYSI